jgi:hypothetical protein
VTYVGLAFLFLAIVGIWTTLRLGAVKGHEWDVMSAYQRREIMRERHKANPALRR